MTFAYPSLRARISATARAATVAIDVGHFLEEPGATSARGRPEFEFNRDLALQIESAARGLGLRTLLIGDDGFMSQLTNPALKRSLACASAIGAALRGAGFVPSLYHADPIPGEHKPFADKTNGVHYYDNLIVLKTARSPAVLLEAGVIVNRNEELRMRSEDTRKRIAGAVAEGLSRCLARRF